MTELLPTVFVVDDDAAVRKGLERLLKSAGLRPESHASSRGIPSVIMLVGLQGSGKTTFAAKLG